MSFREPSLPRKYALVEFICSHTNPKELLPVDAVLGQWMRRKSGEVWECAYPTPDDYEYLDKWIKQETPADPKWKFFNVNVLSWADDYDQVKRRLQRAYSTRNVASSDTEKRSREPVIHSQENVRQILRKTAPMSRKISKFSDENANDLTLDDVTRSDSTASLKPPKKSVKKRNTKKIISSSSASSSPTTPVQVLKKCPVMIRPLNLLKDADSSLSDTSSPPKTLPTRNKKQSRAIVSEDSDQSHDKFPKCVQNRDSKVENLKKSKDADMKCIPDDFKEFVKAELAERQIEIARKIKSAKESILYNLDQKMNELKLVVLAQHVPQVPQIPIEELVMAVGTKLPIENLADFLQFEEQLKTDNAKKTALTALFRFLCFTESTVKTCINNVLPKIMKRSVQSQYSGKGRKVKGKGKLDFSATSTFSCFQAAMHGKFENPKEVEKLSTQVGYWLIHAGDREGGRNERSNIKE